MFKYICYYISSRKRVDEHERLKKAKEEIKKERQESVDMEDEESSSPGDRPKRDRKKKKFFDGEVQVRCLFRALSLLSA